MRGTSPLQDEGRALAVVSARTGEEQLNRSAIVMRPEVKAILLSFLSRRNEAASV
jgi:hypothetical protein